MSTIPNNWKLTSRIPDLETGHCHVWKINFSNTDIGGMTSYDPNILSLQECERSEKFLSHDDKLRYKVIRSSLRQLLSKYIQLSANEIKIDFNRFGKPYLNHQHPVTPFYFNISHAKDIALLAFCRSAEVGVDVEYLERRSKYRQLAQRFFSPQENAKLKNISEQNIALSFFRLWTRKEAFVKAVGTGLGFPLNKFSIAVDGKNRPILSEVDKSKYNGPCCLSDINCQQGYMSSIACLSTEIKTDLFQWPMEST